MTPREFQIEFERRLLIADPTLSMENKLSSDLIFSILNEAIDLFWKTRYSGINIKALGFEQSLKRIDDLRTLVNTKIYTASEIKGSDNNKEYSITLPEDYTILLGDSVDIVPVDSDNMCWLKDKEGNYIPYSTDTLEATIETIDRMKLNSLSEHLLKYCKARPIKLINNNIINLYTDGKYKPNMYTLTYLVSRVSCS